MTVEQGSGQHQVQKVSGYLPNLEIKPRNQSINQKVTEWGRGAGPFTLKPAAYNFNIPHGLALAEDKNEVFFAFSFDLNWTIPCLMLRCAWRIVRMAECNALTLMESLSRL